MIPAQLSSPLEVKRGDTWLLRANVSDSEGAPIDLSGQEALMQLRTAANRPVVLELTSANGMVKLDATGFDLEVPAESMQAILAGVYVFDFQTTDSSGIVSTWLSGKVQVLEDISYVD